MGSALSFVADNFLNWKIYLFVLIQTLATFKLEKSFLSKLLVFVYTFIFFSLLCNCPLRAWYESNDVKLKVSLFIIFLYSAYTGIVPFNYPRKKYSYVVFQYFANLVSFYLVYFFFELYFCRQFTGTEIGLPEFFR